MSNTKARFGYAELRVAAAQGTAVTVTDASVLATDLTLPNWKKGVALALVEAADGANSDETYVLDIIGRDDQVEAYTVLGSVTIPRGTAGAKLFKISIEQYKKHLNYALTLGGTTPSLTLGLVALAVEKVYDPQSDTNLTYL